MPGRLKKRFLRTFIAHLYFLMTVFTSGKRKKKALIWLLFSGILLSSFSYTLDYFEISKNLDIFYSVYKELNTGYVDATKPGQLMKTGIDAMLSSLDPYTVYYTENDIEDYRYMTTGEYGGIGATVNEIGGKIIIAEPYEGFSAFKAGLRAGDQLISVNGVSIEGKKTEEISSLLKGQAGTAVKLKVIKAGQTDITELSLNREEIKNKAVPFSGLLSNGETGYIKLTSFTENCANEVKDAFVALKAKNCKHVVLDLRGNLGGLLHEAVAIVNLFVDRGQTIVYTKGKVPEWDKVYTSEKPALDLQMPLVVLVDENSASASEIVSGALQDLDRAVIIGKRTYGKGLVQQTKDLVYNAKIKYTVAKYYIPSGRCVQALDYSHKDEEGRVDKVPDSLITAFKTKGGRIVYDGAGVMPDIKTPDERFENILLSLISKYHIFEYATQYQLNHKSIGAAGTFSLSDDEYNKFVTYLSTKDYSYKTKSETDLDALKTTAIEEKYFSELENEYNALLKKMQDNKKDDLIKHKASIRRYLEEEIVSRYYYQTGRIEHSLSGDADIKESLQILSNKTAYFNLLSNVVPATKPFNPNKKF